MRRTLFSCLILLWGFPSPGELLAEEIDSHQLAGCLYAYPYVENLPPEQTPAPEGYIPFHMEHYGRHGSRWLLGAEDYSVPVNNLEKAEKAGLLTPLGEKTLQILRSIQKDSEGRLGELSDKGAVQHRMIGRRMAQNFPEIFNAESDIEARATVVIRCILSMVNSLDGIKDISPEVDPKLIDASYADMWYMNFDDKPSWQYKDSIATILLPEYNSTLNGGDSYLDRLVTDPKFARDSVAPGLLPRLYWVLGNTQSHSGQPWILEDVFSADELKAEWLSGNAGWFIHGGNTPLTKGRMPFVQRNLLAKIIEDADSAIASEKPSARLRYGHDGILISIITLMDLGSYGAEIPDFEALENSEWKDFNMIPMGGNLQLVFYRPENSQQTDDILVKAMVNEREVTMPAIPFYGPYYRWHDVRKYYSEKLEKYNKALTDK